MKHPEIPENESERLSALYDYKILDTLSEIEFDEINALAAQICQTPIAFVSFIDSNRQWFKSSIGLDTPETPRDISFCGHAINNPYEPLLVLDATKDERFFDNPLVTGDPNIRFYVGVSLVDSDGFALGTLCALDFVERDLSESQINSLKTLAKSVVNILELREKNREIQNKQQEFEEIANFSNPFILILNKNFEITRFGDNYLKAIPGIVKGDLFETHFKWETQFDWEVLFEKGFSNKRSINFFKTQKDDQKYKASVNCFGDSYIAIFASPVINNLFPISNYHIQYSDFPRHDYIAEYLFLQQASVKSLSEAKELSDKMVAKNKELQNAQQNIDTLARFPNENPNPVLRFDSNFKLVFSNSAAKLNFLTDFLLLSKDIDPAFLDLLVQSKTTEEKEIFHYLSRNGRHYSISIRYISEIEQIIVYSNDISSFILEIEEKREESKRLYSEMDKQRDFYEFILNNIPSDIAVFSPEHKYVFVNPRGIKDPELRKYMIGKDDFDYCKFKGISTDLAIRRRTFFNKIVQSRTFVQWEDDMISANGERNVVLRQMGPVYDNDGNLRLVIGYGVDITERKVTEEKLVEAYKRTLLLENFLDKTSDAIQVSDDSGKIVYMNHVAIDRLGIDEKTVSSLYVQDFEDAFKKPGSWEEHIKDMMMRKSMQVESSNTNVLTGKKFDVEVSVNYQKIEEKGFLIAASRDITERKKNRNEIERLSLVAKNTNNGVLMLDTNRKITWANEAMIKRSGYSLNELLGNSPKKFQTKETNQEILKEIHSKMLNLKPVSAELLHRSKSGEFYWIDLNIQPLFDNERRHTGYMAVEIDITERKNFEDTIAGQNKNLREITDALDQSSLVSVADKNGIIIRANKKFCEVSKYSESELVNKSHNIVNSGCHTEEFWSVIWTTISIGQIWRGEIKNKAKDGSYYWVDSIIYPILDGDGNIEHFLGIHHEITDRKEAEYSLELKSSFQRILMEISTKYINIPLDTLDSAINESLGEIGRFVQVDRVYVFDYNNDKRTISNLFEWCEEGIDPQIEMLQDISYDDVPIWVSKHSKGQEIVVPDVRELPHGKFRELIEEQDIKSLIALPMMDGTACVGFVGFDSVRKTRVFSDDERNLLQLYAQMLVNVGSRTDYIKQIELTKKEIEHINSGLEITVREKTQRNLELAKSITDQEKLVTIGEIASGIAHDLNTPLGSIKSGAESIRFTLENLFKETIWKCSSEQIKFACNRAVETEIELFIGGLQQRREKKHMDEFLENTFSITSEQLRNDLSTNLIRARISTDEISVIDAVVKAPNPLEFLDLIYYVQMTRTFVDTILASTDKATSVVQDMRAFIKDQKTATKKKVNLHQNISTVLNIFNFQLKNKVDLTFEVDQSLEIEGIDIKLFQLWSNLIKNAIESMEDEPIQGRLSILSEEKSNQIIIHVINNGPQIPTEIQEQIFDKFYTTKGQKNGSGLGLSIVKNVVEEHNAEILLDSSNEVTKFSIIFNK